VTGRVTNIATMGPLPNAQVTIGTTGALTGSDGRYTITGVPAGEAIVRVQLLGYGSAEQTVTVNPGQPVSADFELGVQALDLDAIVVTGTAGGTQRRALGNVVSTVEAEAVLVQSPIVNMDQLLAQRSPGLMMLPGGGNVG